MKNRHKGLRVWQFCLLIALLLLLLATMFMPVYSLDAPAVREMYGKLLYVDADSSDIERLMNDAFRMMVSEKTNTDIEKEIDELERETDVSFRSITPVKLISYDTNELNVWAKEYMEIDVSSTIYKLVGSYLSELENQEALIYGLVDFPSEYEMRGLLEEAMQSYKDFPSAYFSLDEVQAIFQPSLISAHSKLQTILCSIYILAVALLIFVIVSFCIKMDKRIPLSISAVYGVFVAISCFVLHSESLKKLYEILCEPINKAISTYKTELGVSMASATDLGFEYLFDPIKSYGYLFAVVVSALITLVSIIAIFVKDSQVAYANEEIIYTPPQVVQEQIIYTPPQEIYEDRKKAEEVVRTMKEQQEQKNSVAIKPPMGIVQCISGVAAGQGFQLPADSKLIVGKSPKRANFIINDAHVSNIHCSIRYNPGDGMYIVKDHSSNGTYVNGMRLQKEVPVMLPAGAVIMLANQNNQIKLG